MILGFVFYWHEWKPTQIKKDCFVEAQGQAKVDYHLSDEGIKEAIEERLAKEKGLPELPKLGKKLYLEYGFEDYYKNCLRERGL